MDESYEYSKVWYDENGPQILVCYNQCLKYKIIVRLPSGLYKLQTPTKLFRPSLTQTVAFCEK